MGSHIVFEFTRKMMNLFCKSGHLVSLLLVASIQWGLAVDPAALNAEPKSDVCPSLSGCFCLLNSSQPTGSAAEDKAGELSTGNRYIVPVSRPIANDYSHIVAVGTPGARDIYVTGFQTVILNKYWILAPSLGQSCRDVVGAEVTIGLGVAAEPTNITACIISPRDDASKISHFILLRIGKPFNSPYKPAVLPLATGEEDLRHGLEFPIPSRRLGTLTRQAHALTDRECARMKNGTLEYRTSAERASVRDTTQYICVGTTQRVDCDVAKKEHSFLVKDNVVVGVRVTTNCHMDDVPNVYEPISKYVEWIKENIKD